MSNPLPGRLNESALWMLLFAAWLVATVSVLGALFLGEVMQLPPCVLCWWQRIFMFPLPILLGIGLFPLDVKVIRYTLPLVAFGWLFALFHLLLIEGVIPERIQPCTQGVPCSEKVIEWFGFVTIPLLSIVSFSTIAALLLAAHYRTHFQESR